MRKGNLTLLDNPRVILFNYHSISVAGGMVNGHHGDGGDVGVPDMVTISDIDEHVINKNLKKRYAANKIYVSINIIKLGFTTRNNTSNRAAGAKIKENYF